MPRRGRDPGKYELQILQYVEAQAEAVLLTVGELAGLLNIEPELCSQAIRTLARRGQLQVILHPGARYELRPGGSSRRRST